MSDTYARVMRSSDGRGDRRSTGSRAPRRSGAAPVAAAGATATTDAVGAAAAPVAGRVTREAGSPAQATFAAAVAAFMAGPDARNQQGLMLEDVPAPKRLAPHATAIAAT